MILLQERQGDVKNKLFTVILAVHRSPECLPFAVASVLAQQLHDFDLYIVCDGAPDETVEVANKLALEDERVHVRSHPKGLRHGELYRHQVLQETNSEYIAHIADDDLWMPHHLSELAKLLSDCDFGNLLHVFIDQGGVIKTYPYDLADASIQQKMLTKNFNFFGPTVAGYKRSLYENLPVGWSPAPKEIHADLYMWRKFLTVANVKVATRFVATSIILPTPLHGNKSLEERRQNIRSWWQRIQSTEGSNFVQERLNAFFAKEVDRSYRHYRRLSVFRLTENLQSIIKKLCRK